MKQKRIMLLGGNYYQMTATKAAKKLGYYVISVDYLPGNPAHALADEYHNVSTVDKEAVLALARELQIDGIASFASDVSAPTVAYVAQELGLFGNPYESIVTITRKDLLKAFMQENGFHTARGKGFSDGRAARAFFAACGKPCMVKPADSSGSKGISKVTKEDDFDEAFSKALGFSRTGTVVVEEYVQRMKHQIAGDGFMLQGKLVFAGMMNSHFDDSCNPFVPIGSSYPSELPERLQKKAQAEVQRLLNLLQIDNGAVNWDILVDENEDVYLIDIGPRNGGNMISEALRLATGVDLAEYSMRLAVGEDCSSLKTAVPTHGCVAAYNIHSTQNGIFQSLDICESIRDDILFTHCFVRPGEPVQRFQNGQMAVGTALFQNRSVEEMVNRMDHIGDYIKVLTHS